MKRWNGWGNTATAYFVPEAALEYLHGMLGDLASFPDAEMEDILPSIPRTRLPSHPLVSADPSVRLLHARGQSLPDWVALRSGRIPDFPDGVASPDTDSQAAELID